MPTPHWIGGVNGTWTNTANWSTAANGTGGAAFPIDGDTVYLDRSTPVSINVNQTIGNVSRIEATGNGWFFAGSTSSGNMATWSLSQPVTINTASTTTLQINGTIAGSGSAAITKSGPGFAYHYGSITGGVPINVTGGVLGFFNFGTLGTGKLTLNGGGIGIWSTPAWSQSNPVDITGDASIGYRGPGADTKPGAITLTGPVNFFNTNRILTIGGVPSGGSDVTLTGALSGTAGFTKAGAGALFIAKHTGTTLSGVITQNTGYVQLGSTTSDGNVFPVAGVTSWAVNTSTTADPLAINTNTTIDPLHIDTFTGTGGVQCMAANGTYIQFKAGALVGLTPAAGSNGFCWQTPSAANVTSTLKVKDFPASGRMTWLFQASTQTASFEFNGAASGSYSPAIAIQRAGAFTALGPVIAANGSAGAALTLGGTLTNEGTGGTTIALTLRGTNTDNNTYSGVMSNGANTLAVTKSEAGRWILSGANTYTGTTTVSAGVLAIGHASGLGASSGAVSVASGATLELSTAGTTTYNKSSGILTLDGAGATVGGVAQGALRCAQSNSVSTYQALNLALANNTTIHVEGAILTLSTTNAWTGAFGLTLKGGGTVNSSATATGHAFTSLDIQNGEYYVTGALNNVSSNGQLGNSATAAGLKIGSATTTGLLGWSGSIAASTNKPWQIGTFGSLIRANGTSGATLTLSGTPTFSNVDTDCTFTLCGTGATAATPNVMSTNFGNNGTGKVTLSKIEAGHWRVSGAVTCDKLSVAGGSLGFNGNNYDNNVELSGTGVLRDVVLTGGGTKAITCASGTPEIVTKAATNNTCTAPVSVSTAGTILKLTTDMSPLTTDQGKVLGNSPVTVNAGAALRTGDSAVQRGQARYGGTVTFKAGSRLYIGG